MRECVLLTGGTGFIGSHLAEKLLNNNYKVVLFKRPISDLWRINHLLNNDNLFLSENLEDIFDNYSINGIFHLATHYIKYHTHDDISSIMRSNLEFPSKLIDLSCKNNVKYFINTGTFFEYSPEPVLDEKSPKKAFNLYSSSKLAFEEILKYYYNEFNIPISTLKLFTPYGPKDDVNKIIPYLIINCLKKQQITINTPDNLLDIVHVYDIADAFLKLKDNILSFDNYEVFNVANSMSYSIKDIYSAIKYSLGLEEKPHLNPKIFANTYKIQNELNWKPKIDIFKGISNTIDFYKGA